MFKLVVILECDMCGESFNRMAISADRNPVAWDYLLAGLEARAETACWTCHIEHYCNSCLESLSVSSIQSVDDSLSAMADDDF